MEIRQSDDRLISTMGFPMLVRWHLYIEPTPSNNLDGLYPLPPGFYNNFYFCGWQGTSQWPVFNQGSRIYPMKYAHCFVVIMCCCGYIVSSYLIHMIYLPIFFCVASLELWTWLPFDVPNNHYIYIIYISWLILGFRPANERRHNDKVKLSLIGWAQT